MVCALATLPHAYRGSRRPKPHYCFLASFFGVGYPFVRLGYSTCGMDLS
jgi:hypothetical protein